MARMTISKAAEKAGVNVETIRFYERRGLIERPPRGPGSSFREYPDETIQRIRFIRHARDLGFSLREAHELASLEADPGSDAAAVHERAAAKLEEVEGKIRHLQEIRAALAKLIEACPRRGSLRSCSIIAALAEVRRDGEEPATGARAGNAR